MITKDQVIKTTLELLDEIQLDTTEIKRLLKEIEDKHLYPKTTYKHAIYVSSTDRRLIEERPTTKKNHELAHEVRKEIPCTKKAFSLGECSTEVNYEDLSLTCKNILEVIPKDTQGYDYARYIGRIIK